MVMELKIRGRVCVSVALCCCLIFFGLERSTFLPAVVGPISSMIRSPNTVRSKSPTINGTIGLGQTHRDRGDLPSFTNGGVIFFYHIYKTGGSTVGKMLHEIASNQRRMYFTMIRKEVDWKTCLWALNVAQREKKLVILEFHIEHPAPRFPSLVEMAPTIKRWRQEAHRRQLGFFSFTLVREPVAHAISFFNFFSVGTTSPTLDVNDWNPFKRMAASPENLMRTFVGNRQCQMLGTDPESTGSVPADILRHPLTEDLNNRKISPSSRDDELNYIHACQSEKVKQVLYKSLDWVGTTETLSNVTLPLLTKLILDDPSVGRNIEPFKVFSKNSHGVNGVKRKDLSPDELERIVKETELDRDIYNEVLQNNTLRGLGLDTRFRSIRRS